MTTQTAYRPGPDRDETRTGLLAAIRERVTAGPSAVALVEGDRALTYAELYAEAQGVAARVVAAGARPGDPVGLAAVRGADTVVAMLGILLADAGFVPLDPTDPPGRLAGIVRDAGVHIVVTGPRFSSAFTGAGLRCVAAAGPVAEADPVAVGPAGLGWADDPDALAYVIHTSGTTGRAKGVGIPRRALEHFSRVAVDYYEMRPGDRILQFVSMSFDACIEEVFPPLLAGATIVLRDDEMISSIAGFLDRCAAWEISVLFLPTAYWHELVDAMVRDGLRLPASVRVVTAGGEEIRSDRVAGWRALPLDPRVRLVNEYGPTECTVVATVDELAGPRSDAELPTEPTVGRPLPGVAFRVVGEDGADLPAGQDGELLLGGPVVAVGYLGQPELTANRFGVGQDGQRYYRTGDRVRLRPDGRLAFRGRIDRQLKVRGFRVEPAEVERALLAHPAVRDAVVDLDRARGALAAYLIMDGTDVGALRAYLKDHLPAHSVPSRLVPVASFPRNDRDKVDFPALHGAPELSTVPQEDGTELERQVAALAAGVLKAGAVGLDESLLDLGAHSLSLVQISTRITRDLGVRLTIADLHATPTVRAIAALVAARAADEAGPAAEGRAGLVAREGGLVARAGGFVAREGGLVAGAGGLVMGAGGSAGDEVSPVAAGKTGLTGADGGVGAGLATAGVVRPLTEFQRDTWLAEQFHPGTPLHTIGLRYRITGTADPARIQAALDGVVARHDALRATFRQDGDEPVMVFGGPARPVPLAVHHAGGDPAARLRAERGRTVLDPAAGGLIAATLLLGDDGTELVVAVHHLVFDGWSATTLAEDLAALLDGVEPEPAGDYAGHLAGPRPDSLPYWKQRLAGLDTEVLVPADRPRPPVRSFRGGLVERPVDPGLLTAAGELARRSGASVATVVLAALQAVLSRVTGRTDITVLSPVAHRTDAGRERTVGAFITVVPLRTDVSGDPDFATLVTRAQDTVLGALSHDDPPMGRLPAALGLPGRPDRGPLTQVMLIVQNTPPAIATSGDTRVEFLGGTHPDMTKLDLTFSVDFPDGAPVLYAEYAAELFDAASVERLADEVLTLLAAGVADPRQPVARLPLFSASQRVRLLDAASAPSAPDLGAPADLIAGFARTTPDAIAVSLGDERWTYRRLDDEAATLATRLSAAGVGRGDRVAIRLPRSPGSYAAILAAWRVGAAYLPVDPDYPVDRQEYLLADGDVRAVIGPGGIEARPATAGSAALGSAALGSAVAQGDAAGSDGVRGDGVRGDGVQGDGVQGDVAYVLYTSGTTGKPKGVLVSHANLRHAVAGWRAAYDLRPGQVHLQAAGFSFDVFAGESLRALATGGHLVVCPRETLLDADALHELLRTEKVAVAELVPTVLRGLLGHDRLPDLRILAGGAEKWYVHEYRRARALVGAGGRVVNSYGVTEATIDNAYFDGDVAGMGDDAVLPIGRPYPGNVLTVRDPYGEPVPYGTAGELWIGGAGVALGYHNRPELTAERFRDGWYLTGDAARVRPDGTVHLLGRLDDQVKVSGHRIELGEVEAALAALPGVTAAAADVRDGRIAGYLVGVTGREPGLRRALQDTLPHFAVPAHLVSVPELPLTPNGKVDRRALPDPPPENHDAARAEPETATQRGLATIWATLLGRGPGPDDAFFALGGDSFSALRMARAVHAEYGVRIALLDLYRNPVLRDLAAHLDSLLAPAPDPAAPAAPAAPATLLQRLTRDDTDPTRGTLICLPYSGGHALSFEPLAAAMPDGWAVHALQVPGRDWSRPDEPSPTFDDLMTATLAEVSALPGPFYLYGHCHGSAMTMELGRRMEAAGMPLKGVAVGAMFPMARLPGKVADWVYRRFQPDRLVSDRAILDEIRALGGGFDEFADPAERAFAMRAVRHDERGSEDFYARTLRDDGGPKLKAPILSVVGDKDRVTELYTERYREWEQYSDDVSLAVIPKAGHGFLKHQAVPLAGILGGDWPAPVPREKLDGPKPSLRRFGVVAAGQFVSLVGSALSQLVMSLWVFQQTGRITDFAFISAVALLPGILAGPFAGAVADRYDRRKVMLVSDGAAGLATIILIGLMWADNLQIAQVYALCALTSLASAFQRPAYAAAISQLVPKAFLGQANGIAQLGVGAGALFAPMLAAPLLAVLPLQSVLLVDVATFLVAVVTLQAVRFPDRAFKKREETVRAQILHGWRFIAKRPGLVSALWFFTVDHIFYTAGFALIVPLILIEHDTATLGLVLSAGGVGTLVGALIMSVWGGTVRRTDGMIVFMAVNNIGLMVVGLFTEPWLLVLGMFTMSASESLINGHWMSLIQAKVGFDLQGRVLSIFMTVMMLTMPLGYVLVGPAADHWFRPLLEPSGALAGTLGPVLGTGPGRGLALVIVVSGIIMTLWAARGWFNRRLRFVEDALPDLTPTGEIEDRDTQQRLADARL
ncbi:amino acid adenylation domain-containing protein [Actinoplanes sp. NPDC051494]|uniref:amino acid adenylation domain-containing protein n=1 Tax=Actinoplanes sp. NPDC051494 TaxID=3363907 RepID=UPI0037B5C83D